MISKFSVGGRNDWNKVNPRGLNTERGGGRGEEGDTSSMLVSRSVSFKPDVASRASSLRYTDTM